ncbi:hypothetical protein FOZ60_016455 [Perkinsus olseni]|uniref:Uncharacterized protein n=1 Tax=Perkinsus olseni TaxID=32597 RepID=A0A7J6P4D7_PEROL|nr:hypothetical protein FOZ60_016455 [Perkinsus olseni]
MARRRPLRKLADAVVIAPSHHDNSITHATPVEQQQQHDDDGKVIDDDERPPSSDIITHHHHHADGNDESIIHQHVHEEVPLHVDNNNLSEYDVPKEVLPLLSTPVGKVNINNNNLISRTPSTPHHHRALSRSSVLLGTSRSVPDLGRWTTTAAGRGIIDDTASTSLLLSTPQRRVLHSPRTISSHYNTRTTPPHPPDTPLGRSFRRRVRVASGVVWDTSGISKTYREYKCYG